MKQKKENSVALLLHWAGEQKFWLFYWQSCCPCAAGCALLFHTLGFTG
ncbi:MAG: hypothetical protein ACLRIT_00725 [Blautia sp.]